MIDLLALSPVPEIGEALQFLLDIRLDEGVIGEEEAARRLRTWWAERS